MKLVQLLLIFGFISVLFAAPREIAEYINDEDAADHIVHLEDEDEDEDGVDNIDPEVENYEVEERLEESDPWFFSGFRKGRRRRYPIYRIVSSFPRFRFRKK